MDDLMFSGTIPLSDYRQRLRAAKQKYTYDYLSGDLCVNQYYLWNIVKNDEYIPPDWVCRRLGIKMEAPLVVLPCDKCGIPHPPVVHCPCKNGKDKRPHRFKIYSGRDFIDRSVSSVLKQMEPDTAEEFIRAAQNALNAHQRKHGGEK